ncbi:MAG: T9SS type A sorting domain-containing protein [Bacteroidales bacterium]
MKKISTLLFSILTIIPFLSEGQNVNYRETKGVTLDSIAKYSVDKDDNLTLASKEYLTSNKQGFLTEYKKFNLENGKSTLVALTKYTWAEEGYHSKKQEYTYKKDGTPEKEFEEEVKKNDKGLVLEYKKILKEDHFAQDKLYIKEKEKHNYSYYPNDSVKIHEKTEYTEEYGNLKSTIKYTQFQKMETYKRLSSNGTLIEIKYSYNKQELLTEKIQYWNNKLYAKTIYSYNKHELLTEKIQYQGDKLYAKEERSYYNNDILQEKVNYIYSNEKKWNFISKTENKISDDKITTSTEYSFNKDNQEWVCDTIVDFEYKEDKANNTNTIIQNCQTKDEEGEFYISSRETKTYDAQKRLIAHINARFVFPYLLRMEGRLRVTSSYFCKYNEKGLLEYEKDYYNDYEPDSRKDRSDWTNTITYNYDKKGRMIYKNHTTTTYSNGNGQNTKTTWTYDENDVLIDYTTFQGSSAGIFEYTEKVIRVDLKLTKDNLAPSAILFLGNDKAILEKHFIDVEYEGGVDKIKTQQKHKSYYYYSSHVGINETINSNQINIYPNPAQNNVNIDLPQEVQNAKVCFINLNGSIIKECEISNSTQIKIGDLARGLYICKVIYGKKVEVKKVLLK